MKKSKKTKYNYIVTCYYPYTNNFSTLDEKLIKAVGKQPSDSGAGFGERDIDWNFKSYGSAKLAFNALQPYVKELISLSLDIRKSI